MMLATSFRSSKMQFPMKFRLDYIDSKIPARNKEIHQMIHKLDIYFSKGWQWIESLELKFLMDFSV